MAKSSDPNIRAWWVKQLQHREDAVGGRASTANRKRRAQEAAAQEALPTHISNLMHAAANSEAPLRPEVRAVVDQEIQRRLKALRE